VHDKEKVQHRQRNSLHAVASQCNVDYRFKTTFFAINLFKHTSFKSWRHPVQWRCVRFVTSL